MLQLEPSVLAKSFEKYKDQLDFPVAASVCVSIAGSHRLQYDNLIPQRKNVLHIEDSLWVLQHSYPEINLKELYETNLFTISDFALAHQNSSTAALPQQSLLRNLLAWYWQSYETLSANYKPSETTIVSVTCYDSNGVSQDHQLIVNQFISHDYLKQVLLTKIFRKLDSVDDYHFLASSYQYTHSGTSRKINEKLVLVHKSLCHFTWTISPNSSVKFWIKLPPLVPEICVEFDQNCTVEMLARYLAYLPASIDGITISCDGKLNEEKILEKLPTMKQLRVNYFVLDIPTAPTHWTTKYNLFFVGEETLDEMFEYQMEAPPYNVINKLLDNQMPLIEEVQDILQKIALVVSAEPNIVSIQDEVIAVADPNSLLHSNFEDIISLFQRFNFPESNYHILFTGNMSRGTDSFRLLLVLFLFKIHFPNKITLLKGDKDDEDYHNQLTEKKKDLKSVILDHYDKSVYLAVLNALNNLPIGARVYDTAFLCNGAIAYYDLAHGQELLEQLTLDHMQSVNRQDTKNPIVKYLIEGSYGRKADGRRFLQIVGTDYLISTRLRHSFDIADFNVIHFHSLLDVCYQSCVVEISKNSITVRPLLAARKYWMGTKKQRRQ